MFNTDRICDTLNTDRICVFDMLFGPNFLILSVAKFANAGTSSNSSSHQRFKGNIKGTLWGH